MEQIIKGVIMKKTINFFFGVVFFITALSSTVDAKPEYCEVALRQCRELCEAAWWWIPDVREACQAGCYIGYLNCGGSWQW